MTEQLNHFPEFLHFLERVELSADRVAWSSRRVRDELRGERRQRMERADFELYKLLSNANRFLDHLARERVITTRGADDLASFLLISARAVIRETTSANAWGWAPTHDRRRSAERAWRLAQKRSTMRDAWGSAERAWRLAQSANAWGRVSAVEQLIEQNRREKERQSKGDSCGKH